MQQHKIEREQGWSVVRLCSGHFPPPPHSSQALSHTVFIIRDSEEKNVFSLDQTNLGPRYPKAYKKRNKSIVLVYYYIYCLYGHLVSTPVMSSKKL